MSKSKSLGGKSRRATKERNGQCDKYHLSLSFHAFLHHSSMFPLMKEGSAFYQSPPQKCLGAQALWTCALQLPNGTSTAGGIPVPIASSSAPFHHLCCQRGDSTLRHSTLCQKQGASYCRRLLLRSHNTPRFVHSLPNCNDS